MKWNLRLALSAWVLFVVSFFLTACTGYKGWQCAGISACCVYEEFQFLFMSIKSFYQHWGEILIASLTFANLFMLVSPFLFLKSLRKVSALYWLRILSVTALGLVGGFYMLEGRSDLRIGFYAWTASFLLLFLSSVLRHRAPKPHAIAAN